MEIIKDLEQWQSIFKKLQNQNTVGFVPTMGALHDGHISLMEKSLSENDITAVSILVNKAQFNNPNDFNSYPITWDEDIEILERIGVHYLFAPNYEDIYPDGYRYKIIEDDFAKQLCGASRPGHFDGVLTVVMKLLNLTKATKAYFGEKDWQQYKLIKEMAETFFMDTDIISCPLIREKTGLALSSRNKLLTKKQMVLAPIFYQTISSTKSLKEMRDDLSEHGFKIDYLNVIDNRLFGAVFLGEVRLIDNVPFLN
ncbi:MAG: pantoate--beta-alanine ligase [Desulfotalea sp.]